MFDKRPFFLVLVPLVALYAAGCGGSSHSTAAGTQNNPLLTITPAALPAGYVGSDYAATTLKASGGSGTGYSWSLSGTAALPAGLTLSSAGVIAGRPTATGSANFSVRVTDSAGAGATAQFSVTVKPGVSITTALALPDAYVGSSYSQALGASGGSGSGYTWALASGSNLPDGLTLSAAGLLNGKPAGSGAMSFSVIVTDSAQNTATAQFSGSIKPGLSIFTPGLPPAYLGSAYAQQLIASGGSGLGYAWSLANAAPAIRPKARRMVTSGLPTGLSLSPDGWITGTPTASGDFTATVIVTDSASNTASTDVSISIDSGIVITTASALPGGNQGDLYSQKFAAVGGAGSGYVWTVASGTTLPGGLILSSDGTLSGSLPAASSYAFGITVTDSAQNSATGTFTLTVVNPLRFTTSVRLPQTYPGVTYQLTLMARGGSGHGYTYTLSAGSSLPDGLTLTSTGVLGGKAASAGTYQFNVKVTDSAANTAAADFFLTVDAGVTITTPPTLPGATVESPYMQMLTVTGGSGSGYIWTLTQGAASLSAVGLRFSNGVVSGTPTATGTASFSVSVVDSSLTYANGTFTVAVNSPGAGFTVSGQVRLITTCSGGLSVPTVNLAITASGSSTALAITTTDANGGYSFNNIPNGTYIITPAMNQGTAVFSPNSYANINVSGGDISAKDFGVALGFEVTGTVNYSGSLTGPVYVTLINNTCTGDGGFGTAMTAPGQFTIHGVAPGNYTVHTWIDTLHTGVPNLNDPSANAAAAIDVSSADITSGADVTIPDTPLSAPPASNPTIGNVTPTDQGVAIFYGPSTGGNGVEAAASYDVQWSTDPGFDSVSGSASFKANGTGVTVWILNNATQGITGSFSNGQTSYFRARSRNSFGHTPGWSYFGPQEAPTAVVIGAPTGGHAVTGTLSIPATLSIANNAQLYAGFFDTSNGAVYAARVSPVPGANTYSVNVPDGDSYIFFGMLDQNNDGLINSGDVSSTWSRRDSITAVHSDLTGQDLTLSTSNSNAYVFTGYFQNTSPGQSGDLVSNGYTLQLAIGEGNKLPVAVQMTGGKNVVLPMDISNECMGCGNVQFQNLLNLDALAPAVGDSYTFHVTYSDGTSEDIQGTVSQWGNTGNVVGAGSLATDLQPTGNTYSQPSGSPAQPTFTWTDPSGAASYSYQFQLFGGSGTLWQVPGVGSQSNGMSNAITAIPWGTDPLGGGNVPPPSLGSGMYTWQILVQDTNGNSATSQTYFQIP